MKYFKIKCSNCGYVDYFEEGWDNDVGSVPPVLCPECNEMGLESVGEISPHYYTRLTQDHGSIHEIIQDSLESLKEFFLMIREEKWGCLFWIVFFLVCYLLAK